MTILDTSGKHLFTEETDEEGQDAMKNSGPVSPNERSPSRLLQVPEENESVDSQQARVDAMLEQADDGY